MTGAALDARLAAELADPASARWFRAPGRVNLMGDHTDYNEGFVLPLAIELECMIAAVERHDGHVRARSLDVEEDPVVVPADGSAEPRGVTPAWGRYVAGVVSALAARGRPSVGLDAVLSSSVPSGSGLSSSAAIEVATALAVSAVADFSLPAKELALACQRGEQLATGVPSGIMDQLASIAGRAEHALAIDCRTLDVDHVRMPPELAVLVVHSGVYRTLEGSAYAERRAACEALAAKLGLPALRDASLDQVREEPLGRHVVTENARVHETARALAVGDTAALGELFAASHASLRNDFRVSTPELDLLVEALTDAGAIGARLTGAGFGGAVVALSEQERVTSVAAAATARYREATRLEPTAVVTRAAAGAGPLTPRLEDALAGA